jgi:hypothetical protein
VRLERVVPDRRIAPLAEERRVRCRHDDPAARSLLEHVEHRLHVRLRDVLDHLAHERGVHEPWSGKGISCCQTRR